MSIGSPVGRVAGADRAAVDHEAGPIQPAERHQRPGHVLVAAGQHDAGVVPLGAHHGFDRVGDEVARLQRVAHAVGAHRDAVGDADRVEPHADEPGRLHALLHFGREVQQVHVARVALEPHAGDADLRLLHVVFGHAGGVEHGLRRALRFGLRDLTAVFIEGRGHEFYSLANACHTNQVFTLWAPRAERHFLARDTLHLCPHRLGGPAFWVRFAQDQVSL